MKHRAVGVLWVPVVVLVLVSLVSVGGSWAPLPPAALAAPAAPPVPQEMAVGLTALPVNLDPVQDNGLTALATYSLLYDRLIDIDEKGAEQPALALSWRSTSPRTWEFKLREGVRFHNGEAFDAAAAKFAIDRALTAPESRFRPTLGPISRVTAVDATTLVVETSEPFSMLPSRLGTRVWMYPPRYFQERGDAARFAAAPVGSGRFKFVEWQRDNFVVLERNDTYWGERARLARVRLRHMTDQTSRWTSLEAREIHLAYIIDPEQAERLERAGFKVINQPVGQGFQYFFRTTIRSPITDVRVRRAINYAVDKEGIAKVFFGGLARLLQGQPVGPDADGFDPGIRPYTYNPTRAKALLTEAGYANGFNVQIDAGIGFAPRAKEVAEVVSDQLRKVGINAEVVLNERGVYLDKLVNAKMSPMWELSLNYAPSFDLLSVLNNFICDTLHKSHCDPQFDALYKKWAGTFDRNEQRRLGNQALRYISDQALSLFLWQVPGIYVVAPTVQGLKMRGDYTMDLSQVVLTGR